MSKPTIGLLITLCSRNQNYLTLGHADIFKWLLPSLFETWELDKFNYKLFIGFDDDDKFYLEHSENLTKRLKKISTFTLLTGCQGNPCKAWNILLTKNINNADYFFQVGSDIKLISKGWSSYFVNILTKNNNVGMCGGVDKGYWYQRLLQNESGIIENGFFHKTHYEIFKTLFNEKFKTWFSDDYITRVYGLNAKCFLCPNILFRNINRVGQSEFNDRYLPDTSIRDTWKKYANNDAEKLFNYISVN